MRFADECRQAAAPIWAAIFAPPLLRQMCAGTLPLDTFRCVLVQDRRDLDAVARCVGRALGKAEDTAMRARLTARVTAPVEKTLHRTLLGWLRVDPATISALPVAPTTRAYRNHLLVTATLGTLGETAAAPGAGGAPALCRLGGILYGPPPPPGAPGDRWGPKEVSAECLLAQLFGQMTVPGERTHTGRRGWCYLKANVVAAKARFARRANESIGPPDPPV